MKLSRCPLLLALVAIAAGAIACGTKRPPAVATAPGAGGAVAPSTGRAEHTQPVDEGPDLRSLENEGVGQDLLTETGEGGPLTDIRFDYDEASLTDEARTTLDRHVVWLQSHPDVRLSAEGHCDERGTVEYNLALGDRRAQAARDYLVSKGVAAERFRTVSYGKERPLDSGRDEAAYSRNRRAHFAVMR